MGKKKLIFCLEVTSMEKAMDVQRYLLQFVHVATTGKGLTTGTETVTLNLARSLRDGQVELLDSSIVDATKSSRR